MIKKAWIRQAVEILRELNLKFHEDSSKKKNLLEGDNGGSLFLQISLKRIPSIENIKMIKMPLPNSTPLDDACLITGDLDKNNKKADIEPDILHYKEILSNCGVTGISEVITLRQLRTDYKSYEARQLLLAAYDTFIADKRIVGTLPKVLGKHFFKKRKFPIQIDLKSEDLKRDIKYALSEKVLFLSGHGNSCVLEVAHLDMDDSKIIENVMVAVNTLSEKLPGSSDNIMGLYLRIARSKAIPIYMSYENKPAVTPSDELNNFADNEPDSQTRQEKPHKVKKRKTTHSPEKSFNGSGSDSQMNQTKKPNQSFKSKKQKGGSPSSKNLNGSANHSPKNLKKQMKVKKLKKKIRKEN